MDSDNFGRSVFTVDFIASVCEQCDLEPYGYFKHLAMQKGKKFNPATIGSYVMKFKIATQIFPEVSERLAVVQLVK